MCLKFEDMQLSDTTVQVAASSDLNKLHSTDWLTEVQRSSRRSRQQNEIIKLIHKC